MPTLRTLLPAAGLALTLATAAEASDDGYLGDGQPWIVGAGAIAFRASERTELAGSVRVGHRLGRLGDVRLGLEVGKGVLAPFGEVLLMPVELGRLTLGVSVAAGLRREDGVNAFFVRAAPMLAFRPFSMPSRPVCGGCPVPNDHSPLQLELGLPEVEGRFAGGSPVLAVGASLRVAVRF